MRYPKHLLLAFFFGLISLTSLGQQSPKHVPPEPLPYRTVHCFVALCDNENQGIVPVPQKIGNGQDPTHNLYWGAGYGVKNYFRRKDPQWTLLKTWNPKEPEILERALFKHQSKEVYLLADAYDGAHMKKTLEDFFAAASGNGKLTVDWDSTLIQFGGAHELVSFNGHNGIMDLEIRNKYRGPAPNPREAIIIACYSKSYFTPYLRSAGIQAPVWSTHLMSAEGYTTAWAVNAWVEGKAPKEMAEQAAQAYHRYQHCGIKGARNLITSGW